MLFVDLSLFLILINEMLPRNPRNPRTRNPRPKKRGEGLTHFVGLDVARALGATAEAVQLRLCEGFGLDPQARVNVADDAHVTVMLLRLESVRHEEMVLDVLRRAARDFFFNGAAPAVMRQRPLTANATGTSTFGAGVLYIAPRFETESDFQLLQDFRAHLIHRTITEIPARLVRVLDPPGRPWIPHVTLLKNTYVAREAQIPLNTIDYAQFDEEFKRLGPFPVLSRVDLFACHGARRPAEQREEEEEEEEMEDASLGVPRHCQRYRRVGTVFTDTDPRGEGERG